MKFLLPALLCASCALSAQSLHVTFRSKMTFAGQTVANVWGYASAGREYALIGASQGLVIADISDPDAPKQIVQIPGPNNLWKEIKTYGHFAYVVSEGGQGIQVIDLSNLPSANLNYHYYKGDGALQDLLGKIHALHIDTTKGFLYAYGGNIFNGGAKVFDLKPDPYNPRYAGKFDALGYIHDGYADNDTLYAAHISQGLFSIVDMSDKTNPNLIATQNTPNNFTHNTWLSDDRRTLFTTDETSNSFLAAYDISNPQNIRLLDKIQSNPGSGSAVHNTQILGNFAVTAWYRDGFNIVDISRPGNLVEVGHYDIYPSASGSGFDGCWGVYPYFPSGTVIASIISLPGANTGELWVLTPEYVRACYLEGKITDGFTGHPLNGALIEVTGSDQSNSGLDGSFYMGQEAEGYFTVRVSKAGYETQQFTVFFQRGDVKTLNIGLFPSAGISVSGTVLNGADDSPVPGAQVFFLGKSATREVLTDTAGHFALNNLSAGSYTLIAEAPGMGKAVSFTQKVTNNQVFTLHLFPFEKLQKGTAFAPAQAGARPNPFSETVEIQLPADAGGGWLSVFSVAGQLVERRKISEGKTTFTLGDAWLPGVYWLRLEKAEQVFQFLRLIKTKAP